MTTDIDSEMTQMLADEFSRIIRDRLTPLQMAEVLRRNESNPRDVCATRAFCDANMAMTEAFALFFKRRCDPNSAADSALWSTAWALARSAGFPRKIALIQDAHGVPVNAIPIRDQWIENPHRSACGRFAVDPEQHYGLRAEEIDALDDANSQLRRDRTDENLPATVSDRSRRDDERIQNAIADVCRSYPNTEKHTEGDRFVFLLRCEDGSSLLMTKCCDEEAPPDGTIEVAVGRCTANGDVVEENIVPIDELEIWIDCALSSVSNPRNVADYFAKTLGAAHGEDTLRNLPLNSSCGKECVKAIDAAAALIACIRTAFCGDQVPPIVATVEAVRQVITIYWDCE